MLKFVFLDIDGVLNSDAFRLSHPFSEYLPKLERQYPPRFAFLLSQLDPMAVERLSRLVDESSAKIVVSSSWRFEPMLPALLRAGGLNAKLYDRTGLSQNRNRGEEIKEWLKGVDEPYSYVILDDEGGFLPDQMSHWIAVDPTVGLIDSDVEKALRILDGM